MAVKKLNRDQFYDKLARLDEADLKKALWTLYWRGSGPIRERIEAAIDPQVESVRKAAALARPDAEAVLAEAREFARLARAGAYLAGDRRVSPKERTRWRFTFRRLATEALAALAGDDVETASAALAVLVDLACDTRGHDYFRSEDPLEAARFVVSDAVAAMWARYLQHHGFAGFAERAAEQLVRWESRYGWTRHGYGWVAERERTLGEVAAGMLTIPDAWAQFAEHYLVALDRAPAKSRTDRAEALSDWHGRLLERLAGSDDDDRLDALAEHPALAGPERTGRR